VRYLALAASGILVWVLLVLAEALGKSLDAAGSDAEPRGTHLFPAPVLICWALVGIAYAADSRWFSQDPAAYPGFWAVFALLVALALYAAGLCVRALLGLRRRRSRQ
jgi:hypothetical protein